MQKRKFFASVFSVLILFVAAVLCGCGNGASNPIVIWTNKAEVVSYVELFNASQDYCKAIVVYKSNPSQSLPPAKDEKVPDIIIGTDLKSEHVRKNFSPISYLLHNVHMKKNSFYSNVLNTGKVGGVQYLIPVSFNLPMVIFSKDNSEYIPNDYVLSLEEIKEISLKYNKKNSKGVYTSMGFAPRWSSEFMYEVMKMQNVRFKSSDRTNRNFSWDWNSLYASINYIRDWTSECNGSSAEEEDYKFKYLYQPAYKLVQDNLCLFQYVTSDEFFSLPEEKRFGVDYRWIHNAGKTPVEDDIVCLGLYRHSKNVENAEHFIIWLLNEETQNQIIARNKSLKLNSATFGILGGFSSVQGVNEKVITQYIPTLMRNLPINDYITTLNTMPSYWPLIKESVIYPYLLDTTDTTKDDADIILPDRIKIWKKQYF